MKKLDITIEDVLSDIKDLYEQHGSLTRRMYDKHGKWSSSAICKAFGPFNVLKKKAIGNRAIVFNDIPKEELVKDVMSVLYTEGRITQEVYLEKGRFSRKPILRYFSSWNNMLKELDIKYNCLINIPDEDLLADLKRIYEEYDDISATVVKHHGKFCVEVYQRRFGSFNKALTMVGLETKVRGRTSPIADSMIKMVEELINEQATPEATADWFVNPKTGRNLYADAFFPAHNLVFEYNGIQHYVEVEHYGGSVALEKRIELDKIKADILKEKGFNLLIFKYDEPHTREHMIVRLGQIFQQQ